MSIADRLKELRKSKNITQKELSENTGISLQSIVNYEIWPPLNLTVERWPH